MTLTFGTPKDSLYSFTWLHLPTFKSQTTRFWKLHCFNFFPYKGIMDQIWSCRKIGQGQLRVIIWTNLVVFEYPKLLTKFQGHRHICFQRRRMFHVFTIYGRTIWTNFRSPIPLRYKIWLQSAKRFLRKRSLKMLNLSDVGPRSMNDLDLWFSYRFVYSFS